MKKYLFATVMAVALAGCGKDGGTSMPGAGPALVTSTLEGVYRSEDGKHTLTFTSDSKVKTILFGQPIETTYAIEANSVKFKFPDGLPEACEIKNPTTLHCMMVASNYTKVS